MPTAFWRTGLVNITDAELTLIDAFADNGALPFHFIRDPIFPLSFNRDSHAMDDVSLQLLLARWLRIGWLHARDAHDGLRYGLTPLGLQIWERERRPDWSRFVVNSHRESEDSGRTIETELGASKPVIEAFHALRQELTGVSSLRVRRLRMTIDRARLHPVKILSPLFAIVSVRPHANEPTDWARYERERIWWRDSVELMRWRGRVP
jgi:hypothetical protein